MADVLELDDLAAAEQRVAEVRNARHRKRLALLGQLAALQQRAATLVSPAKLPNANDDPTVRRLHDEWWAAKQAVVAQDQKHLQALHRGVIVSPDAYERHKTEQTRLANEASRAESRYIDAVTERAKVLYAAHDAAEKQRVVDAAQCRAEIARLEGELDRLAT